MPAANYELGLTLDPLIDEVILELKSNGWSASKGIRYGIPYIRIKRQGFFYTIAYENLGWVPFFDKLPEVFVPKTKKYWAWSALLDHENPNTTGFLEYGDLDYWLKPRGAIRGLGTRFSHTDLLLSIYILLWDPCAVPNSFSHLHQTKKPADVCPVCTPPKEFSKVISDGFIPRDYLNLFADRESMEHRETIEILFAADPDDVELDEPIELSGLRDRFETESDHRKGLAKKALSTGKKSNIPEHFLYRRYSDVPGMRMRTWLVESGSDVAHLGRDTNLGSLPDNSIPAIKTNCDLVWLELPSVLDKDFGGNKPCIKCFHSSFEDLDKSGEGRRVTDLSWAEGSLHEFPRESHFFNLGWGQPIIAPKNTEDKESWYRSAINEFGVFALLLTSQINSSVDLMDDKNDGKLVQELLRDGHPSSFKCLECGTEQSISDLCEEHATPDSSSKYFRLISLGSVVRLGPKLLCSKCRSLTYGFDYPDMNESNEVLQAMVDYREFTGTIPDLDWRRRPILRDLPSGLNSKKCQELTLSAISVVKRMPSGFRSYLHDNGKSVMWEQDPANWWELLYRAGLVSKFKQTARGKQGVAEDGHLCLSMLEWKFCNFLFANGIEHDKEPRYSRSNQTRADYLVGDLYIEIAGLLGDTNYEEKLNAKLRRANTSKQRVLVLNPREIDFIVRSNTFDYGDLESLWEDSVENGGLSSLAFH